MRSGGLQNYSQIEIMVVDVDATTHWLRHVAQYLAQRDKLTAMLVCRAWYDVINDPNQWKELDFRGLNHPT